MKKILSILFVCAVSLSAFADQGKMKEIFLNDYGERTSATLNRAINLTKSGDKANFVLNGGEWAVSTNVTFPADSTLTIEPGSSFAVGLGSTVTVTSVSFRADDQVVFSGAGSAVGDATFIFRWPNWGNTTQFDIGDGVFNEAQIEQFITNGNLTWESATTQRMDYAVITNLTVDGTATFNSNMVFGAAAITSLNAVVEQYIANNPITSSTGTFDKIIVNTFDHSPQESVTFSYATNTFTSAGWQADIDDLSKYIPEGETVLFDFSDGTYTITNAIEIEGFYGGGAITVSDTNATVGLSTNRTVIIDSSAFDGRSFACNDNDVFITVNGIKFNFDDGANQSGLRFVSNPGTMVIQNNWLVNSEGSTDALCEFILCPSAQVITTYMTGGAAGVSSETASQVYCGVNTNIVTQPTYGYSASDAGYIGVGGAYPTGSSADEIESQGGQIYP